MTTTTQTLASWLLEQIAADEAAANAATPWPWHAPLSGGIWSGSDLPVMSWVVKGHDSIALMDAQHIARQDPAHVLAVCAAHRAIVEMHHEATMKEQTDVLYVDYLVNGMCFTCRKYLPCDTLRALAQPYADRPGFREEWRA